MPTKKPLRHLRIDGYTTSEKYRPPSIVVKAPTLPERNRAKHGKKLVQQLKDTETAIDAINEESERQPTGFNITLEGETQLQNVLKSLDAARQGIELANVRTTRDGIEATVFVPQGKLSFFKKRVQDYLDEAKDSSKGVPRNAPLVASVNQIGLAALRSFWTDADPFPGLDTTAWWEVWIRASGKETGPENTFRQEARHLKMDVNPLSVRFLDRVVLLVFGPLRTFKDSFLLLDTVAEIRKAKECPTAYSHLPAAEQKAWADDFLSRVSYNKKSLVSVCVLDTGVDRGNILLKPFIDQDHVLTCFPEGNPADHEGHGTEMAGLSLFGDLAPLVAGKQSVEVLHRLESVKILPATGQNHPDHYAGITEQATYRIESVNPTGKRAFCLAVTTTDFRDRGQPTAWSGALDQLAFGETTDTPKRLFFVAAGNTDSAHRHRYPASNQTDGIHDPAQSWNAVTVGCYADRVNIQSPGYSGWKPVAQTGELGPASSTSLIWAKPWPLKPDFVLEGGNCALNPKGDFADTIDDLAILTTARMAHGKVFSLTGDTSAATALAARLAAVIHSTYPDYWPETARALLVHSAEWTNAMTRQFPVKTKKDIEKRVKCVGFGVPSLNRALWCAGNDLTLVAQSTIQPFEAKSASQVSLRNINLHEIPWPASELRGLGDVPVTMRVTLSYFIEPSPGMRGWTQKFRYASHGLRFEVIRPLETPAKFRSRLNQLAREEEEDGGFKPEGEKQPWVLGSKLRSRGSIHSDWWTGNAAALADCNLIGVFPVSGWWKERPKFERWKHEVRYSLVVSIRTPEQTIDLYTPVETRISTPITI